MSLSNGENLRKRRTKLGLSQAELGERLGVTANTIARWERDVVPAQHWRMVFLALDALAHEVAERGKPDDWRIRTEWLRRAEQQLDAETRASPERLAEAMRQAEADADRAIQP